MARKKAIVILPHLIDAGGDMTKKWWIEYSFRNPKTGVMQRFRNYTLFTNVPTAKSRYNLAAKFIAELKAKIQSGWTPFSEEQEKYIYEDELTYSAVADNYGKMRESNRTVRTYLSDFLSRKKAEINKKSFQTYQSKIRSFCAYLEQRNLDLVDVSAINSNLITEYLIFKVETKKLSKASIGKYQQILYTFFDYLISQKVIKANPVENIPLVGVVKDCAPYPISERDRLLLSEKIKEVDRQLWLACCLMYYSAIRPGEEIRLLRVRDISFEGRKIIVKSDSAKSNRTDAVDMPKQLYDELIYQRIDIASADLYVFGKYGRPGEECLGKNTLRNRFNRIRDDLKLSKTYKLYSWKHTGAEALADHGASTWEIQAHLRHRNIDTTERYARKRLGNRNSRIKNEFPDI